METPNYRQHRYRSSFFLPIALITVGIVWLMINNGIIPIENTYRLIPLWPLVLVIAGVGLILRRIWWPLNGLLWAATAVGVVAVMLNPPAFLPKSNLSAQLKHETISEPVGSAKSATTQLDLSVYSSQISALPASSTDLISADVNHIGTINFVTTGTDQKTVQLGEDFSSGFMRFDWLMTGQVDPWKIGLTPNIPLRLKINSGTGASALDLTGLKLESLTIDGGTGSSRITLPQSSSRFPFKFDIGTGSVSITVPDDTAFDLNVDGGTGSLIIFLPEGAGVQVDVRSGGIGSLNLPGFNKVRGGESRDKEGVWENDAYASADYPINIILDIGTGSVNIR